MMKHALAIEFGGQSIKSALVDQLGAMTRRNRMILRQDNPLPLEAFAAGLDDLIRVTLGGARPSAVGAAHPNPCDPGSLTFRLAHKPAYRHINGHALKPLILSSTGCSECYSIYDAGAAALGELWQGDIDGQGRFLLLTLGTGLGAAFIEDGLIVTGKQVCGIPASGEVWDLPYEDTVLEDFTGTTKAAVAIYRRLGGSDGEVIAGDLKKLASMRAQGVQGRIVTEAFAEFGRRLGEGIASVVRAFHPDAIILSGNISKAFDLFEAAADEALERELAGSSVRAKLLPSTLVDIGGLLGAAFRAFCPDRPYRRD